MDAKESGSLNVWSSNPETIEGQVQVMSSLYTTHPKVMNSNLAYRRNPIQVLRLAGKLGHQLGLDHELQVVEPTDVHFLEYVADGAVYEPSESLHLLAQKINREYAETRGILEGTLLDTLNRNFENGEKINSILRLSPLLFDSKGELRSTEKIASVLQNPIELATTYWIDSQESILEYLKSVNSKIRIRSIDQDVINVRNRLPKRGDFIKRRSFSLSNVSCAISLGVNGTKGK